MSTATRTVSKGRGAAWWYDLVSSFKLQFLEGLGGTVHGSFFFHAHPIIIYDDAVFHFDTTSHGKDSLFNTSSINNSSKSFPKSSNNGIATTSSPPPSPSASPLANIHQCTIASQLQNYFTLTYFIYTPNLIWFLLALVLWYFVPYPSFSLDHSNEDDNYNINSNSNSNSIINTTRTTTMISVKFLFQQRLVFNLLLVWIYYGFWHVSLYVWHWGQRPWLISSHRIYRLTKVIHNAWYTTLGTVQWTFTETAILYVVYIKQPVQQQNQFQSMNQTQVCLNTAISESSSLLSSSSSSPSSSSPSWSWWWLIVVIMFALAVPVIRDVHFYVAHRFMHVRFLYKYMHALHHRNTDVEPFSGMSMHPTEHLYYFTCYGPWLIMAQELQLLLLLLNRNMTSGGNTSSTSCNQQAYAIPHVFAFGLFWMGVHVLLSPAASHSGFEDHWQADLYHYLHHRYFDCNYASPALPFDKWMGTFRDRLVVGGGVKGTDGVDGPATAVAAHDEDENENDNKEERHLGSNSDPKASVVFWDGGLPSRDEVAFYLLGIALPLTILVYTTWGGDETRQSKLMDYRSMAMTLALSLIMAAALLHSWSFRPKTHSWWKHYMAPFHEDSYISLILHFVVGAFLCCVLPLYCLLSALLAPTIGVSSTR